VTNVNNEKRNDKALRVAMIALRAFAEYSSAKKRAIEKAF